ncbi:MAG: CGGC domain-containing protein [Proteobacteria bacterium]|nr:CGGC domain-containing protein [Pseudomonadota bacterium]
MEKILIVGCKRVMDDVCIACSRCMVAFNKREGEFARYKDTDAQLIGILGCGDCPGAGIVPRLAQVKLWNAPMGEIPTKVHVATCLVDHCIHKETLIKKIRAKAGVEVVEGSHPYRPDNIYAG